ncbi:hypothetical protein EV360DRAFT_75545 [Lentinula raphanica]|nr:hypothetical protein EV360DRAFT_75545 [Lentinula raphanica]
MPKTTSTPTLPSTTPVSRKQTSTAELIKMRTRMIVDRLMSIRASRSMSMHPPCPRFDPRAEKVARKDLFHGASDNVNGPLHPGFWKLGKIFFVITKLNPAPEDKAQIIFEEASIPAAVLLADNDLLRHLDLRATLKSFSRRVTRGISSSGSSSLPSSPSTRYSSATSSCSTPVNPSTPLPLPVTPGMSTVLVPSTPGAVAPARSNVEANPSERSVNPGRAQSPNDEVEFLSTVLVPSTPGAVAARSNVIAASSKHSVNPGRAQSPDDEVEFIGFLHPNGTVQPERPAKARASVGGSSRGNQRSARVAPIITINIIVWFTDTYKLEAVRLPLASGQYMKLSMVSKVLQKLDLDILEDLDRYTPTKGWNLILLDTLFKVQDGDVLNLKYSAVHNIRNFDIHITHLY